MNLDKLLTYVPSVASVSPVHRGAEGVGPAAACHHSGGRGANRTRYFILGPIGGTGGTGGTFTLQSDCFYVCTTRVRACDTSGACSGGVGRRGSPRSPSPPGAAPVTSR